MRRGKSNASTVVVELPVTVTAVSLARRFLRLSLWILIPFILWWFLRDVPLLNIWESVRQLRGSAILTLIGLNVLIFVLIGSRWWLILRAQGYKLPLSSVIGYRLAGFGVTYFTPGPQFGGEPLQIYLLNHRDGIPTPTAVASVTLDKLLELMANFTFLLLGAIMFIRTGFSGLEGEYTLLIPLVGMMLLPVGYLMVLHRGKTPVSWLLGWFVKQFQESDFLAKGEKTARATEEQVAQFNRDQPGVLVLGAGLSGLIWVLMVVEFGLALHYLGADLSLPLVMIALTAARLAFLFPFPAGLGSLEAGQILVMGLLGINPAVGLSLALLIRARDMVLAGSGLWLAGIFGSKGVATGKSKS